MEGGLSSSRFNGLKGWMSSYTQRKSYPPEPQGAKNSNSE